MSKEESKERFLNQRSNKFTIVLNDNELHLFKNSRFIVRQFTTEEDLCCIFIACILHDKDVDHETNHVKTPHYHVVVYFDRNYRIGSIINLIVNMFHCNENQISIDKCTSIEMQTRYLIHLDEYENDKHHYLQSDVVTNREDILDNYLTLVKIGDLKDCIKVVRQYHYDLEEIMAHISNYDTFRKYINDLINNHYRKRC